MLETYRVMAFLATTDAARAAAFYRDTLGLELVADEPYALVFRGGGTMLRIQKVREHRPAQCTALGWHVPDMTAAVEQLTARGVRFERYPSLEQSSAGVWTAPGGAKVAWFKDTDGNTLSITEGADSGRDALVPEIFVHDGVGALAFYCAAFGARERSRMMTPDGTKLVHGELVLEGHRLFVCDEFLDVGTCRSPRTLGGTPLRLTLQVAESAAFVERATVAGARVTMPVQAMFWGALYGKLVDPYGHEWGINQQRQVLTPEQEAANASRYFEESGRT